MTLGQMLTSCQPRCQLCVEQVLIKALIKCWLSFDQGWIVGINWHLMQTTDTLSTQESNFLLSHWSVCPMPELQSKTCQIHAQLVLVTVACVS